MNKWLKEKGVFLLLGLVVLWFMFNYYSKCKSQDSMQNASGMPTTTSSSSKGPAPSMTTSNPSDYYAPVQGVHTTTHGMQKPALDDPSMLLPKDNNSQWSKLTPQGDGIMKNINMLQAGSQIGINTVGSSLRNANLQLRSEPPNPRTANTGPWLQSTITPDTTRKTFELGMS